MPRGWRDYSAIILLRMPAGLQLDEIGMNRKVWIEVLLEGMLGLLVAYRGSYWLAFAGPAIGDHVFRVWFPRY